MLAQKLKDLMRLPEPRWDAPRPVDTAYGGGAAERNGRRLARPQRQRRAHGAPFGQRQRLTHCAAERNRRCKRRTHPHRRWRAHSAP